MVFDRIGPEHPLIGVNLKSGGIVMQEIPETGFLRLPQVLSIIPVGKTCWYAGMKSGRFPKPVKLSERCTAWKAEDIRELVKKLGGNMAEQNSGPAH
jgi:predicted DNA-binding transcriptional regulator AlpA